MMLLDVMQVHGQKFEVKEAISTLGTAACDFA